MVLLTAKRFAVVLVMVLALAPVVWSQTVRVGVYENKPKVFTDEQGKASGIFIEILRHIAIEEGWQLEFVSGTWSEGLERLREGTIELMPDVAFSDKRAEIYEFTDVPVLSSWFHVYGHRDGEIESVLDLRGKKVAVLRDSIQQDVFTDMSKGFGLDCEIVPLDEYETALETLDGKGVDAVILNRFYGRQHGAKYRVKETPVMFHPTQLYFASPKGHTELLATVDQHLTAMRENPESAYFRVLRRWLRQDETVPYPRWLVTLALALVVVTALAVAGNLLLKWQVERRTEELRRSERNYREVFNGTHDAVIIHDEETGAILDVNQTMLDLFGYPNREAVLRLSVGEISAGRPPFTEEEAMRWMRKASEEGPQLVEWRCKRADGTDFAVEVALKATEIGGHGRMLAAVRDVTLRKEVEDALKESEERYRVLVDGSPIPILVHTDGKVVFSNRAAARALGGESGKDLLGKTVSELVHPDYLELARSRIKQLYEKAGDAPLVEEKFLKLDGTSIDVVCMASMVDYDGKPASQVVFMDVTERRDAEKALRESERKFRSLTETLAAMVVLVQGDRIVYVNPAVGAITGFPAEHFIGMRFDEPIHPDDRAAILERRRAREEGDKGIHRYDARLLHADGTYRWIDSSVFVTEFDGKLSTLVTGFDVTDRRRAEEALAKSEQRWREMYTQTPVMVMGVDEKGRISEVSDYWCKTLQYEREDFLGMNGMATSPPGVSELLGETWERLLTGAEPRGGLPVDFQKVLSGLTAMFSDACTDECESPPVIYTEDSGPVMRSAVEEYFERGMTGGDLSEYLKNAPVRMRKKDGTAIDVLMTTIFELDEDLNVSGMLSVAVDVTEQKQLQAQILHQDKIAAVGTLAAGVAHEIGNPLLAISMAAQSLLRKTDDEYQKKKLDLIGTHIDRISKIVRQMSDLARPPTDEKSRCDINDVVTRALDIVRYDKRAKRSDIRLELAEGRTHINAVDQDGDGGAVRDVTLRKEVE
ncbi:PAS domain S-box protein, partial [Planctomycetota bacterium]